MDYLDAKRHGHAIELLPGDELAQLVGGFALDFPVLDGAIADVQQALFGEVRNEAGVGAVLDYHCGSGLGPFGCHAAEIHLPPVERHLLRRRALGVLVRVPQLDGGVHVEHAAVVAPLEDVAAVNVPGQVNQQVACFQIFA